MAGLLAVSCMTLEAPVVGGFAASLDTELASRMAKLSRYGVGVRHIAATEIAELEAIRSAYAQLSLADAEALVIAKADGVVLLTGDGPLRKAAERTGVEVKGVLGELKRLVGAVTIDPPAALTALDAIVASGSRLPAEQVARTRQQLLQRIGQEPGQG
jgi:predicted nucleic acid-binding protein